jgi:hypothetical protein
MEGKDENDLLQKAAITWCVGRCVWDSGPVSTPYERRHSMKYETKVVRTRLHTTQKRCRHRHLRLFFVADASGIDVQKRHHLKRRNVVDLALTKHHDEL